MYGSDKREGAGDLPSSYCTVILKHRTHLKNSNPFFDAGKEHLVRGWRTTEVIVPVRDSRIHENHPLLGIAYLRLRHVFRKRSQIIENFPLVGGIGFRLHRRFFDSKFHRTGPAVLKESI